MIKVFLLDDDEDHNELNIFFMKRLGITDVEFRTSAREAVLYLENCKTNNDFPDLMFIDLNIPGTNGFQFIETFEQYFKAVAPQTRIIMLTNSALDRDKDLALKYETVIDFMSKPLNKEKILELIERVSKIQSKKCKNEC